MSDGNSSSKEIRIKIGTKDARIRWGVGRPQHGSLQVGKEDNPEFPEASFRPARMGWLGHPKDGQHEILSTPKELEEANHLVRKINGVARFGYQIPAYSLSRDKDRGAFSGLVFPGTQTKLSSIYGTVDWLKQNWGKDIDSNFPGVNFLSWFTGLFNYRGDGDFSQMLNGNEQRIRIFRKDLKDPNGPVSVLGIPAIDTNFYGYPPYSATSGRPSRSLTYVRFDDPESKMQYENALLNHRTPLRLQNAIHSILFSPDVTSNLVGMNNSKGFDFIVRDTKPSEKYFGSLDSALNDFAGLGFDYSKSAESGANNKPIVV